MSPSCTAEGPVLGLELGVAVQVGVHAVPDFVAHGGGPHAARLVWEKPAMRPRAWKWDGEARIRKDWQEFNDIEFINLQTNGSQFTL